MLARLWKLFLATLQLSAFTFGGGYVIVPLMREKFVDEYEWVEEKEMLDLVTISQSAPGALAINASIALGYKLAGFVGIFAAVLGTVLPPFIIITIISMAYDYFISNQLIALILEGMQAGVSAVIVNVVISMGFNVVREKNWLLNLLMVLAFVLNYFFKVHVALIMGISLLVGLVVYFVEGRGDV